MNEPTVKLHQSFKKGETIFCVSTREKFEILEVTKAGDYVCKGRAGVMPKSAALKELPADD